MYRNGIRRSYKQNATQRNSVPPAQATDPVYGSDLVQKFIARMM